MSQRGATHVQARDQRLSEQTATRFLEKLCQFQGSAVRSFILTTAKPQQQQELSVNQQVSTFEERGVCVMF